MVELALRISEPPNQSNKYDEYGSQELAHRVGKTLAHSYTIGRVAEFVATLHETVYHFFLQQ